MNILGTYHNALLAQAAYADGLNNAKSDGALRQRLLTELKDKGMTISQAQYIADNFWVVEQQETTASGFSATLFERLENAQWIKTPQKFYP